MKIPLNKIYITGKELAYIKQAIDNGKLSGNGYFTKLCRDVFQKKFGFKNTLLTSSCTDALEMAAILLNIKSGDEVILPAYTFVSTANAFVLRGADVVFADSKPDSPNMDCQSVEKLLSNRTKAIVCMHYAGLPCDLDALMNLSEKYHIPVVEDAAHALGSYYERKSLGTFGALAAFSFHDTKNITCGEGGLLVVNDERYWQRAEIIWEKGTNRAQFSRGEINKYEWMDIGSSFLPSEITAAFLYAQLEEFDNIQSRRISIWNTYYDRLKSLEEKGRFKLPTPTDKHSAHLFYLVCSSAEHRDQLKKHLNERGIGATFHYVSLHASPFYLSHHPQPILLNSEKFFNGLLRLPIYPELSDEDVRFVISSIYEFYNENS